jgi:hypothetical protein
MKVFRLNNSNSFKDIWISNNSALDWVEDSRKPLVNNYDDSETIWRYMDLSKFISILEEKQLFLTRLDKFDDKFEGGYPIEDFLSNAHKLLGSFGEKLFSTSRKSFIEALTVAYKYGFFANCWHINNFESFGMWKVYLNGPEGIAIKTSIGNLRKSINQDNSNKVTYGKVKYLDYDKESILSVYEKNKKDGIYTPPFPVFFKRKAFEYEKEFRIMSMYEAGVSTEENIIEKLLKFKLSAADSIKINVDLNELIQEIYVSPFAGLWYFDMVKKLVKRYGFNIPINQSSLNSIPEYEKQESW